eukprot:1871776-Prorocentrum_lima.AAC.1
MSKTLVVTATRACAKGLSGGIGIGSILVGCTMGGNRWNGQHSALASFWGAAPVVSCEVRTCHTAIKNSTL